MNYSPNQVVSRVFTVPKRIGGHRVIIDLSLPNKYVTKSSFRIEDREIIKNLINPNDFISSCFRIFFENDCCIKVLELGKYYEIV